MTEKWGEIQGIIISTSWRWPRKQQSTANNQLFKERLHLEITRAKPGLLSITHRNHPVAWHFQHFLPFSTSVQALSNLVTQATGTIGNFPGSNENQRQEQQQLPVKIALMQREFATFHLFHGKNTDCSTTCQILSSWSVCLAAFSRRQTKFMHKFQLIQSSKTFSYVKIFRLAWQQEELSRSW